MNVEYISYFHTATVNARKLILFLIKATIIIHTTVPILVSKNILETTYYASDEITVSVHDLVQVDQLQGAITYTYNWTVDIPADTTKCPVKFVNFLDLQ